MRNLGGWVTTCYAAGVVRRQRGLDASRTPSSRGGSKAELADAKVLYTVHAGVLETAQGTPERQGHMQQTMPDTSLAHFFGLGEEAGW